MFWHRLDHLLAALRSRRRVLSLLVDAVVVMLCWNATYLFRLGFERWWEARPGYDPWVMLALTALYLVFLVTLDVPRGLWRFSGFGETKRLALACLLAGGIGGAAVMSAGLAAVPRAVLALHPVITLMGLSLVRGAYRMLYEHMRGQLTGSAAEVRRALVLGAGDAAKLLLAGIQHEGWKVVGLLDDNPMKQGLRIGSTPILGPLEQAGPLARRLGASHLILALPGASLADRRRAIELASRTGLAVLTVPSAAELLAGAQVGRVRDIEPEDLLGREPVQLDEAGIAETLAGKTVLITGGGGSIGSELARQAARYGPARLVIYETSELALYQIEQELAERWPALPVVPLIGDVKDGEHLRRSFAAWRPQIVFHAAAYKHVPLMEQHNAWAALRNNTLGSQQAARAAAEAGVERFVLISTDKAVNPTNVMGATKRAAEMAVSALAPQWPATRFLTVRFGNVLGSSGSVIPKFKEQIARGGPVTVTHPEVIRYFMTIPEAARLVLQAAAIGESGRVYVLDMGEPVRIVELARDLIRLSGHAAGEIEIVFTGLRSGEKLYEELLADADATEPTAMPRILIARLSSSTEGAAGLLQWVAAREWASDAEVQARLAEAVGEYRCARAVEAAAVSVAT